MAGVGRADPARSAHFFDSDSTVPWPRSAVAKEARECLIEVGWVRRT